jgi:cyclopropane fatty-acyl-phospholipid synthase-like methyltransferase
MKKTDKWQSYWNQQSDPRHAQNQTPFFKSVADEIQYHCGDLTGKTVLELGCGDGSILKFMKVEKDGYIGVDFSASLLDIFAINCPGYATQQTGAIEFLKDSDSRFDVIFSFGVLQYFDEAGLEELFTLQRDALNENGFAIHFGIPIAEQRHVFSTGQGTPLTAGSHGRSWFKQIKSRFKNNIGHWHRLHRLSEISAGCGFKNQIYGGINYLYRINLHQAK